MNNGGCNGIKKKKFNKTTACLAILYMLLNNIGDGSTKYFCNALEISRFLFYDYVAEINALFSEFSIIIGYPINLEVRYSKLLNRYIIDEPLDDLYK